MGSTTSEDWRILVDQKRQALDKQIPAAWRLDKVLVEKSLENGLLLELDIPRHSGILSSDELDITENYSAAELLRKLGGGHFTSLAVTTAFCKRAAIAQQLVRTSFLHP